eukprot:6179559-Pleurochrysis_carterae.AAC.4
MFGMGMWRILLAFLYGVMLGVLWECASMCVLLAATLVEHFCGTLVMAVLFLGFAAMAFAVAARADLGRPLLSIMAFRLTAQLAMTLGTGSVRRSMRCRGEISYEMWARAGSVPVLALEPSDVLSRLADFADDDAARHSCMHIRLAAHLGLARPSAERASKRAAAPRTPAHRGRRAAVRSRPRDTSPTRRRTSLHADAPYGDGSTAFTLDGRPAKRYAYSSLMQMRTTSRIRARVRS